MEIQKGSNRSDLNSEMPFGYGAEPNWNLVKAADVSDVEKTALSSFTIAVFSNIDHLDNCFPKTRRLFLRRFPDEAFFLRLV